MRIWILFALLFLHLVTDAQLSIEKKDVTCKGKNNGMLKAIVDGIDGPFDYEWSNGAKTQIATGLKPGDYSVSVFVKNSHQCFATKAARIYDGPEFNVSIRARLLGYTPMPLGCGVIPEFNYQLTAVPHGGKEPYYCSWNGNSDLGHGECTVEVSGKAIRKNVVMSDVNGCTDSETWETEGAARLCARDPNDISGPAGYDTLRWVSVNDEMDFTVRFENDPIFATSAAAAVFVSVPLDDDMDPFSFRLGSLGFGNKVIEIPENSSFYQNRIDYTDDLGFMIDVTAGLDLPNSRFFWLIETIDPLTGQPPTNPLAGFLPVNDTLTGSGEGFINYSCRPKPTTLTGEWIEQQGSIIFDNNDAIVTNTWSNKVDAFAPVTFATPMPDTFYTNVIPFQWNVNDDMGGCGVDFSRVLISTDGVLFNGDALISDTNGYSLILDWGQQYYCKVSGTDFVDNQEEGILDSFYVIQQRSIEFLTPDEDHYCIGDTLWIDAELISIQSVDLSISRDSGMSFVPLANNIFSWPYPVVLDSSHVHPYLFIRASNDGAGMEKWSDPFTVRFLPEVDAGDEIEGCDNEILFVAATGANDYLWFPDTIMGTPEGRYSNVYATASQYAYVRGTDAYGCSAIDSVYLTVNLHSLDTLSQPLCEGDSILIGSDWILTEGYFPVYYANVQGCDSTIVTHVEYQTPCIWPWGPYVFVDIDATGDNNGSSWTNAFNELQDAIYVAGRYENVQEIWVAEGVYKPHATRRDTSFILRDSIRIYGGFIGVEATRAERTSSAALVKFSGDINLPDTLTDNSFHTIQLAANCQDCIVDGLTITYGHANQPSGNNMGAGVLNYGNGYFNNVIFERNFATDVGAALFSAGISANLIIENCTFLLNTSSLGRDVVNLNGAQVEFRGFNSIH